NTIAKLDIDPSQQTAYLLGRQQGAERQSLRFLQLTKDLFPVPRFVTISHPWPPCLKSVLVEPDAFKHRRPFLLSPNSQVPTSSSDVRHRRLEPRKFKNRLGKFTYMTRPRTEERRTLCG